MGGFVTPDAPRSEELSSCVQCGLCLPYCPTYRLTVRESASPRGRIAAMAAVEAGIAAVDDDFDEALSFCLGCRACEAVCPSLVPYGRMFEGARAELVAQRPDAARRVRRVLLGRILGSRGSVRAFTAAAALAQRLRIGRLLPGPARRGLAGIRPLRGRSSSWTGRTVSPAGTPRGTAALLSGCVMDPWFGAVHDATVDLLVEAGYRVVVPADQTCCGALAAHDGHADAARRMAARNVDAFAGADLVVSDSAGCTAHLKDYGHWAPDGETLGSRSRDVTEVVAALIADGSLPRLEPNGVRAAVQDPCHLRHAQRIVAEPRDILRAGGFEPVEIDPDGLCCGAAGVYSVLMPAASAELGARKADQVRAVVADVVSSANPGCEMQLRSHLGAEVRIAHPVELYREALRGRDAGRLTLDA